MFAALQSSPQLREAFLADKFGEQRFRTAISSSVSGGETFRDFQEARKLLFANRGSDRIFREQVRISRNLDPHLREALIQQKAEAAEVSQKIFNLQGAAAGSFRKQIWPRCSWKPDRMTRCPLVCRRSAKSAWKAACCWVVEIGAEELFSGLTRVTSRLKQNKMDFGADGQITEDEASKLGRLNRFIEVTLERFNTENIQRDPNLLSVARNVRSANLGSFADPGTMFAVQENEGCVPKVGTHPGHSSGVDAAATARVQENGEEHQAIRLTQRQRPSGRRGSLQREGDAVIVIDGLLFDNKVGEILVPEPDAIPFRNSTTPGVGVQVTAARGPGFTLTLTRYDPPNLLSAVRNSIRLRIGRRVRITDFYHNLTIRYSDPQNGSLEFVVTQASVVNARNIAAWQGYRLSSTMEKIEPAVRTVSQWTMYAVDREGVV